MRKQLTTLRDIQFTGTGLSRPECVLTHASRLVFASDWDGSGGVAAIAEDGRVARIRIKDCAASIRPNGIALEPGGSVLLAHLGTDSGGLYRLYPDGSHEPVLLEVDGEPLPPSNFPLLDAEGRVWLTVSTRKSPRALDYRPDAASGFIVLIDQGKARIVADGLGYTNELAFSADARHLFVNETFGRRLTRFTVDADGSLGNRSVVHQFGPGDYPDGLTFDADGNAWVTSIVSNRVIRIDPHTGERRTVLEDSVDAHVEAAETAYRDGTMGRPHLDTQPAGRLRNISSLAFGGPDLRTAYLGCLLGDSISSFQVDVPGARPSHFDFDISPLLDQLEF